MTVRVLVVEDNRDLADNVRELFEDTGADVTVCGRAEDVRAHLAHATFDLAIVDVQLPNGVSGLDLLPVLEQAAPDGEVILATGNATLGSAIEAVRRGVFAYLQKPFDPEDLLALGERALAQVTLRRERADLAHELERSEALHRAVVESVDSLIVGLDHEHHVRMWNRCAAETTGWSADEMIGREAAELIDPQDRSELDRSVRAAAEGRFADLTARVRTREGARRIVRWHIAPLTPGGGAAAMVLAAGTDVTEKLDLEARAAEAEALAAMGRLTAGLAHEVRNPLNAAKLQLEIISRAARRLEGDAQRALESRVEIVKSELGRLSRLLDEFLGLARPQHLAMCAVDLRALIDEVVELQSPVADEAGITITKATEEIPPAYGDASKLKQALMNLVVNSIEAIGDAGEGTIVIGAGSSSEGRLELRVEDTGPGLPEPANQLLKPFVTTKAAGTGLGLTIVNKVMELHGGHMEIGPREGGGTVVRLELRSAADRAGS